MSFEHLLDNLLEVTTEPEIYNRVRVKNIPLRHCKLTIVLFLVGGPSNVAVSDGPAGAGGDSIGLIPLSDRDFD